MTKKTPTPLDRISRTVWVIDSRKALEASREQQVRLVEEEHELGLVQVADLGQLLEEVGEQPHQERGEQRGLGLTTPGSSRIGDHAPAVGRGAEQVGGVELGLAEERVGARRRSNPISSRSSTPAVGLGQPAEALQLGRALVARPGTGSPRAGP